MQSVWVVEIDDYDYCRVVGIFSTKENAETVAAVTGGEVKEWPIDPWLEQISEGKRHFRVEIAMDGSMIRTSEEPYGGHYKDSFSLVRNRNTTDVLIGYVFTKDTLDAVRMVREFRAQYIASGVWPQ